VEAELFCADRRIGMTKLTVAFRNIKLRLEKERREMSSSPSTLGQACAGSIQNVKQDWHRGHYFPFCQSDGDACVV